MATMTNSFVSKSNAVRAARKSGLDVSTLTFVQDGMRWTWQEPAEADDAAEPVRMVQLSSEATDYSVIPYEGATEAAQQLADAEGVTITVRDALTDEVLETVDAADEPGDREPFFSPMPAVEDEAVEDEADESEAVGADASAVVQGDTLDSLMDMAVEAQTATMEADMRSDEQKMTDALKAIAAEDAALDPARTYTVTFKFEQKTPHLGLQTAREFAKRLGFGFIVTRPDGKEFPAMPKGRMPKAPKAAKPAKEAKQAKAAVKAPKAANGNGNATGPTGKKAQMVEMCLRPEGASPKELAEALDWTGAPWKWFLTNPKGEGVCDRFGYGLEVIKAADGTRYKLTPPAGVASAA